MNKVSVISLAYNQERYIRQTLDGFVMQATNFPFEVIIHDDASTDKTADIIREYAKRHPKLFKPIYESENQYSKGPYDFINDMLVAATGDYLAFCEGDDYWTDPQKLQLQADFMDKHPAYALCFHPVEVVFDDPKRKTYLYPESHKPGDFTLKALLEANFIQTNSVMYRRQDYSRMPNDIMPQDWYLHLYHAQFGKIGFIDRVMSAYRRHDNGVWADSYEHMERLLLKQGVAWTGMHVAVLEIYQNKPEYRATIESAILTLLHKLLTIDEQRGTDLIDRTLLKYPQAGILLVRNLQQQVQTLDEHSKEQQKIIDHYVRLSQTLEAENAHLKGKKLVKLEDVVKGKLKRRA